MTHTTDILDQGFSCLVEKMGVVNAEYFISLIKRDDFDYTVWQREYFDKLPAGKFAEDAAAYADAHTYKGNGTIL